MLEILQITSIFTYFFTQPKTLEQEVCWIKIMKVFISPEEWVDNESEIINVTDWCTNISLTTAPISISINKYHISALLQHIIT